MKNAHFSSDAPRFHGEAKPCPGWTVGYTAIIEALNLRMPYPPVKALVSAKNRRFETDSWRVFPVKYLPTDSTDQSKVESLYHHLVFALKYEGVNLLVFAKLTEVLEEDELLDLVAISPLGQYSRRIWFLLEWTSGKRIEGKEDIAKKSYVPAVDEALQYAVKGIKSPRHLVLNNLPGTPQFCALISKSKKLEDHISAKSMEAGTQELAGIRRDVLQRASAFLMLKDSRASFTIEGESPKSSRAARWGNAIGTAGVKELTASELIRLQHMVIESNRFVTRGFRTQGGFVGEHDRHSGAPIPEHISCRPEDIEDLVTGLIEANHILMHDAYHAVLAAASISFGFVFIHPFADGNGRIHRYLVHHILAQKKFSAEGIIFPISASILDHLEAYRSVLESQSKPLLEVIEWEETPDHNVQVTHPTKDYYRFFDATKQAEFMFDCVNDTIENIIPQEINYLTNYDAFKQFLDKAFEMPDKWASKLVRFLDQNQGVISKRAREREFSALSQTDVERIEAAYRSIFLED
jgi:Fic family protein